MIGDYFKSTQFGHHVLAHWNTKQPCKILKMWWNTKKVHNSAPKASQKLIICKYILISRALSDSDIQTGLRTRKIQKTRKTTQTNNPEKPRSTGCLLGPPRDNGLRDNSLSQDCAWIPHGGLVCTWIHVQNAPAVHVAREFACRLHLSCSLHVDSRAERTGGAFSTRFECGARLKFKKAPFQKNTKGVIEQFQKSGMFKQ